MLQEDKDFNVSELVDRYERNLCEGTSRVILMWMNWRFISEFYQKRGRNKESSEVVEMGFAPTSEQQHFITKTCYTLSGNRRSKTGFANN